MDRYELEVPKATNVETLERQIFLLKVEKALFLKGNRTTQLYFTISGGQIETLTADFADETSAMIQPHPGHGMTDPNWTVKLLLLNRAKNL